MFKKPPRYHSYLLTLWEERDHQASRSPLWHFRLEDSRTGYREGFASLDRLFVALQDVVATGGQEAEQASAALETGFSWIVNVDH